MKFGEMLEKMDLHEIEQLKFAKQAITYLEGRRRELLTQTETLDEQIRQIKEGQLDPQKVLPRLAMTLSSAAPTVPRKQVRTGTLAQRIVEVLGKQGAPMGIAEIATAVVASGYETACKNFSQQVGITLCKMDTVERVERGLYRLSDIRE